MTIEAKRPEWESVDDTELMALAKRVNPSTLRRLAGVEELRWKVFPALSAGFVTLVDVMGDDAAVVQAARTSYGAGTRHVSEDDALISYLMRHRHTTPFEMAEIKLLIKCPMDMWRQQIRHRTASVNEYSTRYSEAIDEADVTAADEWRLQSELNKQGSSGLLTEWPKGVTLSDDSQREVRGVQHAYMMPISLRGLPETPGHYLSLREARLQEMAREVYEERVKVFGIAREQARKDLPLSTYTIAYWKIDLHNLFHFLGLRMESHAQKEIRDYSNIIGHEIVKPLFPKCWAAFEKYRLDATFVSSSMKQIMHFLITEMRIENRIDAVGAENTPPWGNVAYEKALCSLFPDWMKRKEDGTLKPHREREEVRAGLQALGLLAVE